MFFMLLDSKIFFSKHSIFNFNFFSVFEILTRKAASVVSHLIALFPCISKSSFQSSFFQVKILIFDLVIFLAEEVYNYLYKWNGISEYKITLFSAKQLQRFKDLISVHKQALYCSRKVLWFLWSEDTWLNKKLEQKLSSELFINF